MNEAGFLKNFGYELEENVYRINKKLFLLKKDLREVVEIVGEKPKHVGLFLGETKQKNFVPSTSLLELVSKTTSKKLIVDDKAAWLFVCGRDLMHESIKKGLEYHKKSVVLVSDENNNVLGVARIVDDKKIFANNIFDIGDFLRRET
ncbi:hypothetical protein GOV05_01075 [Candidatus Woesearchaeota archaeon]|nr:hypothetical protein [Candidatus Woesearchaeota archaeon]